MGGRFVLNRFRDSFFGFTAAPNGYTLAATARKFNPRGRVFPMGSSQEQVDEQRKIRRLQMMMDMVMSVISQDSSLTVEQASEMVADTKKAALAMFPDKELAYNLIYKPRFQRLMRERYRIQ
jgi:hypothetical protein